MDFEKPLTVLIECHNFPFKILEFVTIYKLKFVRFKNWITYLNFLINWYGMVDRMSLFFKTRFKIID